MRRYVNNNKASISPKAKSSLTKNTATLYVRMLISMFIGFFTSRILLNQLGVVDFGIYNVVGSIVVMLGFLNATLSLSTQRFINFELGHGDIKQVRKIYSSSVVIHIFLALMVLIVAETVGLWFLNTHINIPADRITAANYVYQFSIFSAFFSLTVVPYTAVIIAHEHMKQYATIGIIDVFLRFSAATVLYLINTDKLIVYALAMFAVVAINYQMYRFYCKKHFEECNFFVVKDKELYRSMLAFSGWNIFSSISILLNGQIVGIVLNMFFGPVVNAARGIATQVNSSTNGFVGNFQLAVNPRIIQTYAGGDFVTFHRLVNQSAKTSFFLLLIFVVPIWIYINDILTLWLGNVPQHAADFCRIVLISSLINTFSLPLATAANANGHIKVFQLGTGIFEMMNIPLSYLMLKLGYEPVSVYYIALAIVIATLLVRLAVLRRLVHLKIAYFLTHIVLRCVVVATFSFMVIFAYSQAVANSNIWWTMLSLVISLALTGASVLSLGLNKNEKAYILEIIKKQLTKR